MNLAIFAAVRVSALIEGLQNAGQHQASTIRDTFGYVPTPTDALKPQQLQELLYFLTRCDILGYLREQVWGTRGHGFESRHSDHSNQLTPKTVLSRAASTSVCDVALRPRRGDIGQQFFKPVHRHGLYQMVIES